ncbi:aspartyl protease family protein [Roseivirga sp.]|uniref:aspartyl protease family protein n=1 Tax=Roseivirga sp. TaxID=1964215 RepID=UPI003B51D9D0
MKIKLLLLALLMCGVSVKAQNPLGFSLSNGKSYVELSFKQESNLIVVPIIINDNGPFNFILDTGSESGMIFDKWVIAENNLVDARKIPIYADNGSKITDILVANDLNIQMTGVEATKQSMLVLKDNHLDVRNILGVDAHGILGSELFNRFVVEIDYENEKIRLYEHAKFKAPRKFKKLDIEVKRFRPYIKTRLKQRGEKKVDLTLLIDTGASSALFLDEERHESIVLPEETIDHTLGSSLTGSLEGQLGRVKKIKVGRFKFKEVLASYPEDWRIQKEVKDNEGSITRYGTLGSDVLSRFTVIYDYLNECVYLKKNKNYKEDFKFNRAGFTFTAGGEDLKQYYVATIIPKSPAALAGLQPNDEIISIAGKPIFFYSFSEVNGFLREEPGTKLDLIIKRDGKLYKKEIKLKRLI